MASIHIVGLIFCLFQCWYSWLHSDSSLPILCCLNGLNHLSLHNSLAPLNPHLHTATPDLPCSWSVSLSRLHRLVPVTLRLSWQQQQHFICQLNTRLIQSIHKWRILNPMFRWPCIWSYFFFWIQSWHCHPRVQGQSQEHVATVVCAGAKSHLKNLLFLWYLGLTSFYIVGMGWPTIDPTYIMLPVMMNTQLNSETLLRNNLYSEICILF